MSAYSALILAASPQAYYRLNESSGTVAHDISGNGYHAAISGATLSQPGAIAGDTDTSMLFTASGGLTLPSTLNPMLWSALTLEFWCNTGTGWNYVVIAVDATSTILYQNGSVTSAGPISGATLLADVLMDFVGNWGISVSFDEVALYNYKMSPVTIFIHYLAGNPPYRFGSFALNDNTNYFLRSKSLDFAEGKPTLQKVAHLDGMKQNASNVNERQIQLLIEVVGSSRADLEAKLDVLDAALTLKQQQLTLHASADNRYFVADCLSAKTVLAGDSPVRAVAACTFLAQSPYAYAQATSTQSIGAASLSLVSGHVYQFTPQAFAGGGTAVSLPTIHLVNTTTVAWTQVVVSDVTDGRTLTITSNLPATTNDYIDIYCDPNLIPSGGYSVQKNGTTACAFNGIFPVLQPTSTSWTIQVTTASSVPSGSALWSWQARYLR